MLADRTQDALRQKNLTPHAAHLRLRMSRESINKLLNGTPIQLELVEQFARGLGLDVNEWRELAGYPRVETGPDRPARPELTYEPDLSDVDVSGFRGAEGIPPGDLERINEVVRDLLAARRRKLGLED